MQPESSAPLTHPPIKQGWFLTGPTASGKTLIGLELARLLNAEILSLDSMAVYREMDIGTAKPRAEERACVPHHLLDLVNPDQEFNLSEFATAAHAQVAEIRSRGKEVLFVGGTPLYLKALLRGVYHGPPADWEFRQQVEQELEQVGVASLHERLQVIDPLLASRLHPHDKRRIIRGLEVFRITGKPLSHEQMQFEEATRSAGNRAFALHWPRAILHTRIEQRVHDMFAAGLVEEVVQLRKKYPALSRTAKQAVGYEEIWNWLAEQPDQASLPQKSGAALNPAASSATVPNGSVPNGSVPDATAALVEMVQARTRQFARRQETWFRSLEECQVVELSEPLDCLRVAAEIFRAG